MVNKREKVALSIVGVMAFATWFNFYLEVMQ